MIQHNRPAYRPSFWLAVAGLALLIALATVGCCIRKRGVVPTDPPPPPPKKALDR